MDLNVHFWRRHRVLSGPQCPFLAVPPHIEWTSMSISGGSHRILLDLNVHIWRFPQHIIGRFHIWRFHIGRRRRRGGGAATAATAATAAPAVSQELWTSGGAVFQRAQEPKIPFGEPLTSILGSWPVLTILEIYLFGYPRFMF